MSHWERLAALSQTHAESDYQKAGYRLAMEQVLYAGDPRSRIAYELIVKHRKEYDVLLAQLGMTVIHNPHMGYVVATRNQYVADKIATDGQINRFTLGFLSSAKPAGVMFREWLSSGEIPLPDSTIVELADESVKRVGFNSSTVSVIFRTYNASTRAVLVK